MLGHRHGERLGATALLEDTHVELDGIEGGRAQEVAIEARRLLELSDHARGAQRDGREVAAVRGPDLPVGREARDILAIVSLETRRILEIRAVLNHLRGILP